MAAQPIGRRPLLRALVGSAALLLSSHAGGEDTNAPRQGAKPHPLDPALELAKEILEHIRKNVENYECNLRKRERVGGQLKDPEVMFTRIRNRKENAEGKLITPLSVYLKYLEPASLRGQEVLWVEGQNNNKLLGHQGGALGKFTPAIWLDPLGSMAMNGNLHPISDIGLESLVVQLIERGERDRKYDECVVESKDAEINRRKCTLLEVKHPVRRPHFDFHIARIYIDKELKLPIMYEAYSWPEADSDKPVLLEQYAYLQLKLNVDLPEDAFSEHHKAYGFH